MLCNHYWHRNQVYSCKWSEFYYFWNQNSICITGTLWLLLTTLWHMDFSFKLVSIHSDTSACGIWWYHWMEFDMFKYHTCLEAILFVLISEVFPSYFSFLWIICFIILQIPLERLICHCDLRISHWYRIAESVSLNIWWSTVQIRRQILKDNLIYGR